jgi:hydroxymethylpyrimidine/phosphomethylpyrimidine kinase
VTHTPVVVAAGGLDPRGGAGLGQDIAFLGRLAVRAAPVVTALTVETGRGPLRVAPVDADLFEDELRAAFDSFGEAVKAIKTGLVVSLAQAESLVRHAALRRIPLVVDPILAAGSGERFVAEDPTRILTPLIKAATLLTPNAREAATLSGEAWDGTRESLLRLARALVGPRRTVAVTGGEAPGDVVAAAIAGPAGEKTVSAPRAPGTKPQGAGCAFASAAAAYIALGLPPLEAATAAHRLVAQALAAARGLPGAPRSPEPWSV